MLTQYHSIDALQSTKGFLFKIIKLFEGTSSSIPRLAYALEVSCLGSRIAMGKASRLARPSQIKLPSSPLLPSRYLRAHMYFTTYNVTSLPTSGGADIVGAQCASTCA